MIRKALNCEQIGEILITIMLGFTLKILLKADCEPQKVSKDMRTDFIIQSAGQHNLQVVATLSLATYFGVNRA